MSMSALAKLNPQIKNLNRINVGQLIHIRAAKNPVPAPKTKTYTVKSGDTFGGIAAKHDLSIAALAKLNPQVKNLNVIHPGDKLVVKKGTAAPAPAPAPSPTPNPKPPPPSTGALPKTVPNTSGLSTAKRYALYEKYIAKHGDAQAKKDLAAGKRVILALRKDTPMSSGPYRGTYDDRIVVLWKDRSGPHVQELLANTEPNRRWAEPANASSKPVGRLADNQTMRFHKAWSTKFGNHLQPYGNPYAQRDEDRDYRFEKNERSYNGSWGGQAMFIHRAWSTDTGSQGCQTMEEGRFNTFWRALGGQKDFSYVLVNVAKA
jgi:LysM repeat protein